MKRREFITLFGGAATWPLAARAQQAMPVIGFLYGVSEAEWADQMAGIRRGLSETGFVEGRNVAIEYRWADGQYDRMPAMAGDLVGRKVSVILAGASNIGVLALMAATQSIPIVFTTGSDPVATGLVPSFSRPGTNVTGIALFSSELLPKRLELLHEVIPTAIKIALIVNPNNPATAQENIRDGQAAASRLGLEIIIVNGASDSEIERAFVTAVQQRAAALLVGSDAFFGNQREQIAALGLRHAIPTFSWERADVASGVLMSYGPSQADMYRQAGVYVGRILKGEKPADLPVQQPTKFELIINLKTAKMLGLMIPEAFLLRADEVIE
jgi:putative tryptophan/tyrosine transport system substrate-binding protein